MSGVGSTFSPQLVILASSAAMNAKIVSKMAVHSQSVHARSDLGQLGQSAVGTWVSSAPGSRWLRVMAPLILIVRSAGTGVSSATRPGGCRVMAPLILIEQLHDLDRTRFRCPIPVWPLDGRAVRVHPARSRHNSKRGDPSPGSAQVGRAIRPPTTRGVPPEGGHFTLACPRGMLPLLRCHLTSPRAICHGQSGMRRFRGPRALGRTPLGRDA